MTALPILGGVGLGICTSCRAPGAFWYEPVLVDWPGVWMCDSCQWPATVRVRIDADLRRRRSGVWVNVPREECDPDNLPMASRARYDED